MRDWAVIRSLMVFGLLVVAVGFSEWIYTPTNVALAASETKDEKRYGNCTVSTSIDLLTDAESQSLICQGELYVGIIIAYYPDKGFATKGLSIGVQAGRQYHRAEKSIAVSLRFYPGPVIKRNAHFGGGYAIIQEPQFVSSLLPQIASGERLIVKVGTKSGIIDLTGSAGAVQDFQRRMTTSQQTLDIPARERF